MERMKYELPEGGIDMNNNRKNSNMQYYPVPCHFYVSKTMAVVMSGDTTVKTVFSPSDRQRIVIHT